MVPADSDACLMMWSALDAVAGVQHLFIGRVGGVDVDVERDEALSRLAPEHRRILEARGFFPSDLATAEQVHGCGVAVATGADFHASADALVTATDGLTLGIYVADCAAIFFADPVRRAVGLAHSGKKGTEQNIASATVAEMQSAFDTRPSDLVAVVSPCIRPPHYEVDFAATIRDQLVTAGVRMVVDDRICTASSPDEFYSYRRERGRTGRMLAAIRLVP